MTESENPLDVVLTPKAWQKQCSLIRFLSLATFFLRWLTFCIVSLFNQKQRTWPNTDATGNSPHPQTPAVPLEDWLKPRCDHNHTTYAYESFKDALESAVVSAMFAGHAQFCAYLFHFRARKRDSVVPIKNSIRKIMRETSKSQKLSSLLCNIMPFLEAIESSSPETIVKCLSHLADNMLRRPSYWYCEFIHINMRSKNLSKLRTDRNLMAMSLFFREGAGVGALSVKEYWVGDKWIMNAALTLLMYASVERYTVQIDGEKEQFASCQKRGTEILLSESIDVKFNRFVSLSRTKCDSLFRDKMMWDVTESFCNEYIECDWKMETLERALWVLQYGKPFLKPNVYTVLKAQHRKAGLDLTVFDAVDVLALSVAGIVNVSTRNGKGSLFTLTGDSDAEIQLSGYAPKITLDTLCQLGLCKMVHEGVFQITEIPGNGGTRKYKGVPVGDRILLVQSDVSNNFRAHSTQTLS